MRKNVFMTLVAGGIAMFSAQNASAQEEVVVEQEDIVVGELVECKDQYYSTWRDNWFIQLSAGMNVPMVEGCLSSGYKTHYTAAYNLGFGKWFSPYFGWRLGFMYAPVHYDTAPDQYGKFRYINANVDVMWDMLNSFNVKQDRVFSIIPFVGIGGLFGWDYKGYGNDYDANGSLKSNEWLLPVSAGLQLRFRLCKYADFFVEGRAMFLSDQFNRHVVAKPIDGNFNVMAGFNINFGGRGFKTYNPCNYLSHIAQLNDEVNALRGDLAVCGAALAAAEAQLPCPEVEKQAPAAAPAPATLMSTVRFRINSARISDEEMVNVFNTAEWMKANPDQKVVIAGYADKKTGTSAYNMKLSQRRADAVKKALTEKYGISADRLTVKANGSDSQPYDTNNWNRIVIFSAE